MAQVAPAWQAPPMTMDEAISTCFRRYATFSGRAGRVEYWGFVVFVWMISFLLAIVDRGLAPQFPEGLASPAWSLVTLLPTLSVTVRRLHDTGRSGGWWWLWLIPLVGWLILLIMLASRGDPGTNRYGPDPAAPAPLARAPGAAPWGPHA